MNLLREKLRARGHHRAMGGGDSSSSSSQSTTYNVSDSRQVHSTDARVYTDSRVSTDSRSFKDSGNTTITTLDGGAIAASRDLGLRAIDQNSTSTVALLTAADRLFGRGAEILNANMALTRDLSATAANAYDGATAQATGNRTMLLVGLAVVGVVAVMAFGGK